MVATQPLGPCVSPAFAALLAGAPRHEAADQVPFALAMRLDGVAQQFILLGRPPAAAAGRERGRARARYKVAAK